MKQIAIFCNSFSKVTAVKNIGLREKRDVVRDFGNARKKYSLNLL